MSPKGFSPGALNTKTLFILLGGLALTLVLTLNHLAQSKRCTGKMLRCRLPSFPDNLPMGFWLPPGEAEGSR